MKAALVLLFLCASFTIGLSQERRIDHRKIPGAVTNYLRKNYTWAKDLEYYQKKENDTLYYEAEFTLARQAYNLRFSLDGTLIETEREIEFDELAAAMQENIVAVLHDNFRNARIKKLQAVNPLNKKQFEVYVKARKGGKYAAGFYRVMFDATGQLLWIAEEELHSIESAF